MSCDFDVNQISSNAFAIHVSHILWDRSVGHGVEVWRAGRILLAGHRHAGIVNGVLAHNAQKPCVLVCS